LAEAEIVMESEFGRLSKMNRYVLGLGSGGVALLIVALAAAPQQTIDNPKIPPAPNAGRIIQLREVGRITDDPGKFSFIEPWEVRADSEGSVYVQEPRQFLKFNAAGKYAGNLLKRGEGPGELDSLTTVIVRKDDVCLYSSNSLKFVRIHPDGRLIEDRKFTQPGELLGYYQGRYFFVRMEWEMVPNFVGIREIKHRLIILPEQGEPIATRFIMPTTVSEMRGSRWGISRIMPVQAGERYVFLFHSPEYLIKLLDLGTGEVVRSFRRPYDRVKYPHPPAKGPAKDLEPTYHNDLCRLLWRNDKLWAVTSTFDKNKGLLVDVFSNEGKYVDNFFLPIFKFGRQNPQLYAPMAIGGNFLYHLEVDENGLLTLVKYEILEE
jgi:hypothetical protein